ncbi:WD repeat-containing protein CG11141 [Prorops nasuta]|uniref:WD repeat-containing protein CG11141 n=1 Tax=Prorops nasuta TaxID=863751 RepID=UPI0034CEC9EB
MTTPMCEDGGPLREWAPLASLLQKIPAKAQNGLFTHDVNFTCIDTVSEFIAIGTNNGLVYWYNREKQDLQKLRCENLHAKITCVQVISTVDYMIAAGNEFGVVTVFQIPKNLPDSLPDNLKPKHKKQVQRYTISDLHKNVVTTVEWSKNGMKLFSGDQDGLVVLTEIDFYMHLSKSSELMNEKYSVVQLSYQQGLLLVSTTLRTILVNRNENGKVTQVGQKERKVLGKLGAVFGTRHSYVQDLTIYASRPGLRLWQANKTGTVLKTLIFKDAIHSSHTEVELLNPVPESMKKNRGEPSFGVVLPFADDLLLTYSDDILYVVNPKTIAITSVVTDLRKIIDVACAKEEIFVLEGERNIIRIAYHPETSAVDSEVNAMSDSLTSIVEISKPVTNSILELTFKLKESTIVPSIPFHKINTSSLVQSLSSSAIIGGTDTAPIVNAEEAVEIPPIVPINLDTPLLTNIDAIPEFNAVNKNNAETEKVDRRKIFQKISQEKFEDIVFTPEKRFKKHRKKVLQNSKNTISLPENEGLPSNSKTTHPSLLTLSIEDDFILKSDRNLENIEKDIENKEKLLADVLDFDLSKYMTRSIQNIQNQDELNKVEEKLPELKQNGNTDSDTEDEDVSYRTELEKLENLEESRKKLLQNKLINNTNNTLKLSNSTVETSEMSDVHDIKQNETGALFNVLVMEHTNVTIDEEDWVLVQIL